ncbi:hypothetical protein H257_06270 [Aphanomyces astaci]|uniref:Mitochondrial 2-oxoglutarate/malate carrier protein n=2 Tax=Aphanomyces astaci TaxID=112090 RepID=W4GP53_APHAT|nr:hypothetical protein H257_06270 [Aphanomyces astaci]ETV80794.1 hypothetical protein H257_06270 [Aphanomyces astaci]RHY08010.1 hypothetical protein DYB36_004302 [Aphanomyces astaci]RHY25549.1 hypothetical protein DYB25_012322 [Aphanomyces astaci]RHY36056.1 hypothetical protein DYB38_000779 [Aphanomyces astaci]RHY65500.1 hypothetical protein DYB34_001195 [Aphanomyces astaci]|eukprot:XP_009829741.1 hypothetical protein H257_06270 [Aphanomyces astaci]
MADPSSLYYAALPFFIGGTSGMVATACVQPIDMVKVQIQSRTAVASPFAIVRELVGSQGVTALYTGLGAGLLRQATYTTARLGIFDVLSRRLKSSDEAKLPFYKRAIAGLVAGGLGSIVGNPCDLVLVRMQTDAHLPVDQQKNYRGVGDAFRRIVADDGVVSLWKGSFPTVLRAMALNMGMLAMYDQAKDVLTPLYGPGTATVFMSSATAGFFASAFSLPFDFIKTRLQSTSTYTGLSDCVVQVIKKEGPATFYRGFGTYYIRIAPHVMITLTVAESLRQLFHE